MDTEYTIRVRTPSGMITEVKVVAKAYGIAASLAQAYGEVLGVIESRYI